MKKAVAAMTTFFVTFLSSRSLLSFDLLLSSLSPTLCSPSVSNSHPSLTLSHLPSLLIAGSTNPQLLRLINSHQQRFIEMLNEPADAAAPAANAPGGGPGAGKSLG